MSFLGILFFEGVVWVLVLLFRALGLALLVVVVVESVEVCWLGDWILSGDLGFLVGDDCGSSEEDGGGASVFKEVGAVASSSLIE